MTERTQSVSASPALTQPDMILVAMYRVSGGSTAKIPYEEIVLQAWRDFPEAFSLRNHPEYPDASNIHKRLYQTLNRAGLTLSLGDKVFQLTGKGVQRAGEIVRELEERSRGVHESPTN